MKIALGAAQFEMNYGLTNEHGKVSRENIRAILEMAKASDINTLDTSPQYGDSELILGDIASNNWNIITKNTRLTSHEKVISTFEKSLLHLKREKVYGLLIHDMEDIHQHGFDKLYKDSIGLKKEGATKK